MNIPTNSNPPARRRVLIIEDDFLLSRLLAQHLDELGHETVGPISLRHASSRIEHGALDAAVLQIRPSAPESIALARALMYKPRWPWEAAAALGATVTASPQYWRGLPREAQSVFGNVKIGQR